MSINRAFMWLRYMNNMYTCFALCWLFAGAFGLWSKAPIAGTVFAFVLGAGWMVCSVCQARHRKRYKYHRNRLFDS